MDGVSRVVVGGDVVGLEVVAVVVDVQTPLAAHEGQIAERHIARIVKLDEGCRLAAGDGGGKNGRFRRVCGALKGKTLHRVPVRSPCPETRTGVISGYVPVST